MYQRQEMSHHQATLSSSSSSPSSSADENNNDFPSMEQLTQDPFMKQVQYGFALTRALAKTKNSHDDDDKYNLHDALRSQLSHSNGIRGFMVSYLTDNATTLDSSPADWEEIPSPLLDILTEQIQTKKNKELIPLICMNVIMPTAMVTMHETEELSENSRTTSQRGLKLLKAFQEDPVVLAHVPAIIQVVVQEEGDEQTSSDKSISVSPELFEYWSKFCEKWGYQELQRKDIADAMKMVLE